MSVWHKPRQMSHLHDLNCFLLANANFDAKMTIPHIFSKLNKAHTAVLIVS